MKKFLPGQVVLGRAGGLVGLVVFDHRENLPLDRVDYEVRGGIHRNAGDGFLVPVVNLMLLIRSEGGERLYAGWVNELEEGVVESLATQPQLPIMFATPLYERVGTALIDNGLREMMQRQLATISLLAK